MNGKTNIKEIAKEVATSVTLTENLSSRGAREFIEKFFDLFFNVLLEEGKRVKVGSFGTFESKKHPARSMIIRFGSRKGEEIEVKPTMKIRFRPSAGLKQRIREILS